MKTFLKSHMETMLVFFAIIFILVILWFLVATIQTVVSQVNRAVVTPTPSPQQGFDLKSAERIDFRGIAVPTSSSASTAPTGSVPAYFPGAPSSSASSSFTASSSVPSSTLPAQSTSSVRAASSTPLK